RNAVEIVETLIDEKGHSLRIDMPEAPIHVHGDAARLSQIFSNIINNAVKYTDSNGVIQVIVSRTSSHVSIRIKDNGLGIPADKLDDIFSMFMQVEAHSTHTKGGLGIGLTLVERLVRLHDGEIVARSDGPGKGSECEVILPCVKARRGGTETPDSSTGAGKSKRWSV